MSYLSLLFAANNSGGTPLAREISKVQAEIRLEDRNFDSFPSWADAEQALPSGVASMEHWLDLNA